MLFTEEKKKERKSRIILDTTNVAKYLWIGRNDKTWYNDIEQTIVELYGKERLYYVAKLLAATSIHTSLKGNIAGFKKQCIKLITACQLWGTCLIS